MEFDKTRVYTAVNAEDLPIGSKCIFANNVFTLKDHVRNNYPSEILINIGTDTCMERFESDFGEWFPLAYLVEPPKEKHYQPFSTIEKAIDAIIQHGGWVKDKKNNVQLLVVGFDDDNVFFLGNGYSCSYTGLFLDYVFADDGSPCGELVEE